MHALGKVLLPVILVALVPVQRCLAGGPFGVGMPSIVEVERPQSPDSTDRTWKENTRLVSSSLAVLLGPFAAHRIYLGTTPKVAIIYGVTFGGFGLLAVTDLAHLLFTKDLEPYRNNDRVFMWVGPPHTPTPP